MEIHTIGFTKKSAAEFFGTLKDAGIRRLIDVRLNNVSQLAAFAKRDDLAFFLRELCDADYVHEPLLAPEGNMLKAYRSGDLEWDDYERQFLNLMSERSVEQAIDWDHLLNRPSVLLCSEPGPERCHRRLVVEYLGLTGINLDAIHL
ncbi:MAG: DUF488 domain-containing protein [bacterium]|nr:DUF488 domain-containing protein [bacterium]